MAATTLVPAARTRTVCDHEPMAAFTTGEQAWVDQLGTLRDTVRQELVRRQLGVHLDTPGSVLDIGCGQGTQAVHLARAGWTVTGVEPSERLRSMCAERAAAARVVLDLVDGTVDTLGETVGSATYDLVCAHGLLMYLHDRSPAIGALAERVRPGGRLSITFRNGHALAARPGFRGDWRAALAAFDASTYLNGIGVTARADRLDAVVADVAANDLEVEAWYGVRVFNDAVPSSTPPPVGEELADLLDAEEEAGRSDPYRWFGSQLHVIARRPLRAGS